MMIRSFLALSVLCCVFSLGCASAEGEDLAESESDLTAGGACRSKRAGDPCSLCGPRQRDCVETMEAKACTPEPYRGRSVLRCRAIAPASYAPCEGKRLGDACTLCAPNDSACFETQELKICDGDGGAANCISDGTVVTQ